MHCYLTLNDFKIQVSVCNKCMGVLKHVTDSGGDTGFPQCSFLLKASTRSCCTTVFMFAPCIALLSLFISPNISER